MIAPKNGNGEAHSSESLPKSTKIFVEGKIHATVRVPFREIELSPTVSHTGRVEVNEPVRVYDTSGPWSDPDFHGDVNQGLPALRSEWILGRGDVERAESSYRPIAGRSDVEIPATLRRQALRAEAVGRKDRDAVALCAAGGCYAGDGIHCVARRLGSGVCSQ